MARASARFSIRVAGHGIAIIVERTWNGLVRDRLGDAGVRGLQADY
jgi:hypothetical protein